MKESEPPEWTPISEQDFLLRLKEATEAHLEQINQLNGLWNQYQWGLAHGYIVKVLENGGGQIAVSLEEKQPIGFKT